LQWVAVEPVVEVVQTHQVATTVRARQHIQEETVVTQDHVDLQVQVAAVEEPL
jgi:hypothetical protein